MGKCRYRKVDPYGALYDRDEQQRQSYRVEREQENYQHDQHAQYAHDDIIRGK